MSSNSTMPSSSIVGVWTLLRFAAGRGALGPEKPAQTISAEFVQDAVAAAGLRLVGASGERASPNRKAGYLLVTQSFDLEAADRRPESLVPERLEALLRHIRASDTYRVSELTWQVRAPSEEVPEPRDALRGCRIEIVGWSPLGR